METVKKEEKFFQYEFSSFVGNGRSLLQARVIRERHKERKKKKKKILVLGNERGIKSVINRLGLIVCIEIRCKYISFLSFFFSFKYNYNNR